MSQVYQYVTDRMVALLEAGTVPWRKPWGAGSTSLPRNWQSRKAYRGVNLLLLDPGEYLTFNQVRAARGSLRKGAKAHMVVFWKPTRWTKKGGEGEEDSERPGLILRYYNVFRVEDCAGIAPHLAPDKAQNPIAAAEAVLGGFADGPQVAEMATDRACYYPALDKVQLPRRAQFADMAAFYNTAFHELVHSTGHPARLGRFSSAEAHAFGSESYSKEELVAEVGAAMLCAQTGILPPTEQQSAAYLAHWVRRLQGDARLIVSAAGQAQKAVDRILGTHFDTHEQEEQ